MVSVRLGKESPEKNGLSACDYIAMHILKEFGNIGYVSDNK
jgi:hypothetical protein